MLFYDAVEYNNKSLHLTAYRLVYQRLNAHEEALIESSLAGPAAGKLGR
jgi:hypothetical protein